MGCWLTYGCCCIKTLSRHQQLVSLSSMESELHALQHVAQEMSALQKVIGRILNTFQEVEVKEVPGVLYSDSESALKLLRNLDVPRKSRHLEIRIKWIKERVSLGQLSLIFRKGVDNPSDLLTKCLGSAAFGIHRSTLGFQVSEGSLAGLVAVAKRSLVFIEVCCRENSAICTIVFFCHRPPATGHRPPATGHRPPATGHRPPAIGHRPPATGHRPPATTEPPTPPATPATGRRPPATTEPPTPLASNC